MGECYSLSTEVFTWARHVLQPFSCWGRSVRSQASGVCNSCLLSYIVPGSVLSDFEVLMHQPPRGKDCCYPHFTGEETEAQNRSAICPVSLSCKWQSWCDLREARLGATNQWLRKQAPSQDCPHLTALSAASS